MCNKIARSPPAIILDLCDRGSVAVLTDSQDRVLDAVIAGKTAFSKVASLYRDGHDLLDVIDLIQAGFLEEWRNDSEGKSLHRERVTLTPWAARRKFVRLVEVGSAHWPAWRQGIDDIGSAAWRRGLVSDDWEPRGTMRELKNWFPGVKGERKPKRKGRKKKEPVPVIDEFSGEPVKIFGLELTRDPAATKKGKQ
jgi:hypothetical protein